MYCKYCGKEIADDSKFCQHCGKHLEKNNVPSLFSQFNVSSTKIKIYLCLGIIWIFITFAISNGWLYGFFSSAILIPLTMYSILYLLNKLGKYSVNILWNENDSKGIKIFKCIYYIVSLGIICIFLDSSSNSYWYDEDTKDWCLYQLFSETSVAWFCLTFVTYIFVFLKSQNERDCLQKEKDKNNQEGSVK